VAFSSRKTLDRRLRTFLNKAWTLIKREFNKALHERYRKEGIVISDLIRTLDISATALEKLKNR